MPCPVCSSYLELMPNIGDSLSGYHEDDEYYTGVKDTVKLLKIIPIGF